MAHQQGKVLEKCKENTKFIEMVKRFRYRKSTITFKTNIVKLINKQPKIKTYSLSLNLLKNYFKLIKETYEEIASEFE